METPGTDRKLHTLRLALGFSAAGWAIPGLAAVLPWTTLMTWVQNKGGMPVEHQELLDYWVRMVGGGCVMLAAVFGVAAWQPRRYQSMIPVLGLVNLAQGALLLVQALRLHQPFDQFIADVGFCIIAGAIIWVLRDSPRSAA